MNGRERKHGREKQGGLEKKRKSRFTIKIVSLLECNRFDSQTNIRNWSGLCSDNTPCCGKSFQAGSTLPKRPQPTGARTVYFLTS